VPHSGVPPSKSPDRIAGMFDAIAGRYDLLNRLLSAGIDRRWRRRTVAALGLRGGERVLDLCTGTADLALAARTANPPAGQVVGIDFSAKMLALARAKIAANGLAKTVLVARGDATSLPVAGLSVDVVTIGFGIRNVERPDVACAEIRRVLKPGGRLAILEFAPPTRPGVRQLYSVYSRYVLPRIGRLISGDQTAYEYLPASIAAYAESEEFVKFLRQNGFDEVKAVPLTLGIVFLYTARKG
jgi:demethylmenaquinone methyltransferase/2-methoxy-6-polyprenyl-1,4-benzoquinol methylase